MFISSIPYLYTGLKASKLVEENEKPELIKYNLSFNLESFSVGEYFNDYITVLTHSVEIVALKREKLYETYTNYGRIFEFIQIFFITIQTTLCVMALKRKFRR